MYRLLLLAAHDPNDLAHGMGVVVNNTLKELASTGGVEVTVGLLQSDTTLRPALAPQPTYRFEEAQAAVAMRRCYWPRHERFRCGLRLMPPADGGAFLEHVRRLSAGADGVLWFGYYWDSVSLRLPSVSRAPVVFHVNDSLSLTEQTRGKRTDLLRSL